jgi:hypothetical protein
MIAICTVTMIGFAAEKIIHQMGRNDEKHRGKQQPFFVGNKKIFQHQERKTQ